MIEQGRIVQYFSEHRADMVRDLVRLASIPSVQGEAKEHAPFGENCARCLH